MSSVFHSQVQETKHSCLACTVLHVSTNYLYSVFSNQAINVGREEIKSAIKDSYFV